MFKSTDIAYVKGLTNPTSFAEHAYAILLTIRFLAPSSET
jgi:hypothetical protein